MENLLGYIVWNLDPVAFWGIRWYSLCWLVGLLGAYLIARWLYKDQKIPDEKFDPLFIYCFVGILIGARLGHCLFYQPDYYLGSGKGIIEMFLPIHFMRDGSVKFTGYEGLASHGGAIGMVIALIIYVRRTGLSFWTVLDNVALATPITAFFIRMGNLMNSEIIGKVADVPWAVIFLRTDPMPRHPGQVYEALAYALLLFIGFFLYKRNKERVGTGFFLGICMTYIFTARFLIEFLKEIQEDFEASLPLDMGQLLSIPFIILGIICLIRSLSMRKV